MDALQGAAARLLGDPAYRRRFFAAATDGRGAREHGLSPAEFAVLRRLDADRLDIVSEGYVGKRWEHVRSAFPRTSALLEPRVAGVRERYLAGTPVPPDDAGERAAFTAFLSTVPLDADARRFLVDLAALERVLHAPEPGLPSYRFHAGARPRRAVVPVVDAAGPLDEVWSPAGPVAVPARYPEAPRRLLVLREGGASLQDLSGSSGGLLAACDGTATVGALVVRFGASAEGRLRAWFRARVVEDAADG